jgi:hypothetical protein
MNVIPSAQKPAGDPHSAEPLNSDSIIPLILDDSDENIELD